jgi:hypothetical protein
MDNLQGFDQISDVFAGLLCPDKKQIGGWQIVLGSDSFCFFSVYFTPEIKVDPQWSHMDFILVNRESSQNLFSAEMGYGDDSVSKMKRLFNSRREHSPRLIIAQVRVFQKTQVIDRDDFFAATGENEGCG